MQGSSDAEGNRGLTTHTSACARPGVRAQAASEVAAQVNALSLGSSGSGASANGTVLVTEAAPQLLSDAEAKANPIKAAGQALKVAASRWDPKNNPLVSRTAQIADKMKELSEGVRTGTAKQMIGSALGIFDVRRRRRGRGRVKARWRRDWR